MLNAEFTYKTVSCHWRELWLHHRSLCIGNDGALSEEPGLSRVADMIELASQFGRYGYRRVAVLLREAGWSVSDGRIERLWKRVGLKCQ
jgi:hypothetical protein